jgi:hypothetical protein
MSTKEISHEDELNYDSYKSLLEITLESVRKLEKFAEKEFDQKTYDLLNSAERALHKLTSE